MFPRLPGGPERQQFLSYGRREGVECGPAMTKAEPVEECFPRRGTSRGWVDEHRPRDLDAEAGVGEEPGLVEIGHDRSESEACFCRSKLGSGAPKVRPHLIGADLEDGGVACPPPCIRPACSVQPLFCYGMGDSPAFTPLLPTLLDWVPMRFVDIGMDCIQCRSPLSLEDAEWLPLLAPKVLPPQSSLRLCPTWIQSALTEYSYLSDH